MKNITRTFLIAAIAACLIGVGLYFWQSMAKPEKPPVVTKAVEAQALSKPDKQPDLPAEEVAKLTRMAKAGWDQGMKSCIGKLGIIDRSFIEKIPSRSLQIGKKGALLVMFSELKTPKKTLYISVTAGEDKSGNCNVTYDLVSYYEEGCSAVKESRFSDYALEGALYEKLPLLSAPGDQAATQKLIFMPLGKKACIGISKRYL